MRIALAIGGAVVLLLATTPAYAVSDRAFLSYAVRNDNAVIQLSQLADARGASTEARNVAGVIEGDHSRARMHAVKLADWRGLIPPKDASAQGKAQIARLQGLHGAAFDRQYVKDMLADNESALAAYRAEAGHGLGQVARYAEMNMPMLKRSLRLTQHLASADQVVGAR
jgi:putative membrane protein